MNNIDYPKFKNMFQSLDIDKILKGEHYALYKDGTRHEVVVEDIITSRDEAKIKYDNNLRNILFQNI